MKLTEFITLLSPLNDCSYTANVEIDSCIDHTDNAVKNSILFITATNVDAILLFKLKVAVKMGVVAIVATSEQPKELSDVTWLQVADIRTGISRCANIFYGKPSRDMRLVGVTGSNGKTTTTHMILFFLQHFFTKGGLIGGNTVFDGVKHHRATHTTPGAIQINQWLAKMQQQQVPAATMEVSSHGLSQQRVADIIFDVAVFTGLTQDHLDYHGDLNTYFAAKAKLFSESRARQGCLFLVNIDNNYGQKLVELIRKRGDQVVTYGFQATADYRTVPLIQTLHHSSFNLVYKNKNYLVRSSLVGDYNLSNLTAAIAVSHLLGNSIRQTVKLTTKIPAVAGRMQQVESPFGFGIFVDYAHTPDGITQVGKSLKKLTSQRLIIVFGCGGNRDVSKRAEMMSSATKYGTLVIVTSDNPRDEEPTKIIEHMLQGASHHNYRVVIDRAEAIEQAIALANDGDIVLIAGKGHENYQIIKQQKLPFNDVKVVKKAIRKRLLLASEEDKKTAKKFSNRSDKVTGSFADKTDKIVKSPAEEAEQSIDE